MPEFLEPEFESPDLPLGIRTLLGKLGCFQGNSRCLDCFRDVTCFWIPETSKFSSAALLYLQNVGNGASRESRAFQIIFLPKPAICCCPTRSLISADIGCVMMILYIIS